VVVVRPGDPCPRCGGPLTVARGVEVAPHLPSSAASTPTRFGLDVAGPGRRAGAADDGLVRGSGVSRAVGVLAEQHHDERGAALASRGLAPYDVHLVPIGRGDQPAPGDRAWPPGWRRPGLTVLLDDRADASAGVKLTDAELLGMAVGRGWSAARARRRHPWSCATRHTGAAAELTTDALVTRLTG